MKSDRLYKKSPSIKRGQDGKVGISKPTEADAEDMGVSGNPLPGDDGKMPISMEQLMAEMHERHMTELKDMHKRHASEYEKRFSNGDEKEED